MKTKFKNGILTIPKLGEEKIKETSSIINMTRKVEGSYFNELCKYFNIKFNSKQADILWGLIYLNDTNCIKFSNE
jgi:hypothetical protein